MPTARREGVLVKPLGDELVAVDTRGDVVHALSAAACAVWQQCDGHMDMDDARVVNGLSFDDFQSALAELSASGLLVEERGFDRRTLLKGAATVGAGAIALPAVWSIVAPTAAMADSGGTPPASDNIYAAMTRYTASGHAAAVPANETFQLYTMPFLRTAKATQGANSPSLLLSSLTRFGSSTDWFASSFSGIYGYAAKSSPASPEPVINVNTASVDQGPTGAVEPANSVVVHPGGNGTCLVVALSLAADVTHTATINFTIDLISASADGVRVALFAAAPGSPTAGLVAGPATDPDIAHAAVALGWSKPNVDGSTVYAVIDMNDSDNGDNAAITFTVAYI